MPIPFAAWEMTFRQFVGRWCHDSFISWITNSTCLFMVSDTPLYAN